MKHCCNCGMRYTSRRHLVEHIGIANPHWPRTSEHDEHIEITLQEWEEKFIKRPDQCGMALISYGSY